jgi:NAD(P)-dependent dehydrogenase (short-subunit alcohol dehydrogenase family)
MKDFRGKLAVITGAGTGMGRELAKKLAAEGCHLALCDVQMDKLEETHALCDKEAPSPVRITTTRCDVSSEADWVAFRDAVTSEHATDHIHLLFNNAGIGGGGSFIADPREEWDRTFAVCWGGVYLGCRTFLPLLIASDEGHVINTSSVNGFWACLGQNPHTAYSSAKFAVKGFTEALILDLRVNAPHVSVSLVMPGHIGTPIVENSRKIISNKSVGELTPDELVRARKFLERAGAPGDLPDTMVAQALQIMSDAFRDSAPTTAAQAAEIILDGVRAKRWRVLVGADAEALDREVRATPEEAYEASFVERLTASGHMQALTR